MEEKEIIQNKLDARQKLATMSREELLELSRNKSEFDRFIAGLASSMNIIFVCYAYKDNDIIREMIKNNMGRFEKNEKLSQDVYNVLRHLDEYAGHSQSYRSDFTNQYISIEEQILGLNKLGMNLNDFDKVGANYFKKIANLDVSDVKTDSAYMATISYLARYHSKYISHSYMLPTIQDTLFDIDKASFDNKKAYKAFKRVAIKSRNKLEKARTSSNTTVAKIKK